MGTAAQQQLKTALAPLAARWQALGKRERRLLAGLGWFLGAVMLWWVAIAPAWRTVSSAPARLDQLDAQLQQMQRLAGETRSLRGAPAIGAPQAQAAVRAATDALGASARLTLAGERASVTFTNVGGAQLRDWLAEVRGAGRARPVEANLTRSATGYSGTVVLLLPGGTL
jgi:general secretion pathway protein M